MKRLLEQGDMRPSRLIVRERLGFRASGPSLTGRKHYVWLCHDAAVQFAIDFGAGRQVVLVTTEGAASVDGFRRLNQTLVEDPRFEPGIPILFDNTSLDTTGLTAAEVLEIGKPPVALGERVGSSKIAVVAPDPRAAGDARMSRDTNRERPEVRIFHSLAAALAWLRHGTLG
jgi:hypothetical protein